MPLHPRLVDRLPLIADIGPGEAYSDPEAAERYAAFHDFDNGWQVPEGVAVSDARITDPGTGVVVPVRWYRPAAPTTTYFLWAHGGGFRAGTLDWVEAHVVAAELADRAGAVVLSVDYRLAGPDVRYPLPIDDVLTAWNELAATAEREVGSAATLSLGGASAGAALALAASLRTEIPQAAVLLAYPFVHFPVPAMDDAILAEMLTLPAPLRFTPASIEDMVAGYVGRVVNVPADALPGHAPVTGPRPVTAILLSEYDELRPSGELLARQHAAAGVDVRVHLQAGVTHGHLNHHPDGPGTAESLDFFAATLVAAAGS